MTIILAYEVKLLYVCLLFIPYILLHNRNYLRAKKWSSKRRSNSSKMNYAMKKWNWFCWKSCDSLNRWRRIFLRYQSTMQTPLNLFQLRILFPINHQTMLIVRPQLHRINCHPCYPCRHFWKGWVNYSFGEFSMYVLLP